jgi:hypothetical protein
MCLACVKSAKSGCTTQSILLVFLTLLEVTLETQFLPPFRHPFFVDEVEWDVIQGAAQPQHMRPMCAAACAAKLAQHLSTLNSPMHLSKLNRCIQRSRGRGRNLGTVS